MDLNSIKNKLQQINQAKAPREKVDYSKVYFKPKAGKYQIRIVPSKFDKNNPFREIYFHYGFAKFPMLALNNWGEKDPIAELAANLRKTKDPDNWKMAKKIEPKMRVFVPVVVRGQEDQGVRLWEFSKGVYTQLLSIADDPDYGDYTDIVEGRDFTLEIVQDTLGGRQVNKVSSLRIKPKTSPLSDDSTLVEKLLNEQPDILALNKKFSYDELKEVLQKWVEEKDNTEESEETNENESEETTEVEKTTNANKFDQLFQQK